MSTKFIKNIEDFVCEHCGYEVKGTGYTNHCPHCFYSKHVDINPGDRLNQCGGLMMPVSARPYRGGFRVAHHCLKCGFEKENKVEQSDDLTALTTIIQEINQKLR